MKELTKKKPVWTWVLPLLTILLTFCINRYVNYGGDDYSYINVGRLLNQGAGTFLQQNYINWLNDNGRFLVHLLDSLFLVSNIWIWRVFNSVLLGLLVYFAMKIAKKNQLFVGLGMLGFVLAMHIDMTRQSVYWITGSFNYLYPLVLVLALWFLVQSYEGRGRSIWLAVVGFLAGASVEQGAMMAIGVFVLYFLFRLLGKVSIKRGEVWAFAATLVGAATLFLAPATFRRVAIEAKEPLFTIVLRSGKILLTGLFSNYFISVLVVVLLASALYLWGTKGKLLRLMAGAAGLTIPLALYINIKLQNGLTMNKLAAMGAVALYAVVLVGITLRRLYKAEAFQCISTALIIGGGSLLMMVVSPVFGERNFLFAYFTLALYGLLLLSMAVKPYTWVLLGGFLLFGLSCFGTTFLGFRSNQPVYDANNKLIADWVITDRKKPLVQYKLVDDRYAWSQPYLSGFHERVYKVWIIEYTEFAIIWQDFVQ